MRKKVETLNFIETSGKNFELKDFNLNLDRRSARVIEGDIR